MTKDPTDPIQFRWRNDWAFVAMFLTRLVLQYVGAFALINLACQYWTLNQRSSRLVAFIGALFVTKWLLWLEWRARIRNLEVAIKQFDTELAEEESSRA